MSISTKTGDKTKSINFLKNKKVKISKADIIFKVLNAIDEINIYLSQILHVLNQTKIERKILDLIKIINEIHVVAWYQCLPIANQHFKDLDSNYLKTLESNLEVLEKEIKIIDFVKLANTKESFLLDDMRIKVRKLEGLVVEMVNKYDAYDYSNFLKYLNRLSDVFFIFARKIEKDKNKLVFRKK